MKKSAFNEKKYPYEEPLNRSDNEKSFFYLLF